MFIINTTTSQPSIRAYSISFVELPGYIVFYPENASLKTFIALSDLSSIVDETMLTDEENVVIDPTWSDHDKYLEHGNEIPSGYLNGCYEAGLTHEEAVEGWKCDHVKWNLEKIEKWGGVVKDLHPEHGLYAELGGVM